MQLSLSYREIPAVPGGPFTSALFGRGADDPITDDHQGLGHKYLFAMELCQAQDPDDHSPLMIIRVGAAPAPSHDEIVVISIGP
jgi:hypothetical protein